MANPAGAETVQVAVALSAFIQAVNDADIEALRSHFADDVTLFPPSDPTLTSGRAAAEEWFAAAFARVRALHSEPPYFSVVPEDIQIRVEGAVAVCSFRYQSGATIGRRTFIFRKTPARWKVIHVHADNRPRPE